MNLRLRREKAAIERWRALRRGYRRQRVAATSVEIRRAASRIKGKIRKLQTIVRQEFPTHGFNVSASSNQLRWVSTVLRGAVGNAVALLAEIQAEAVRLDGIAAMRDVDLGG
jgi:hypothetical protein